MYYKIPWYWYCWNSNPGVGKTFLEKICFVFIYLQYYDFLFVTKRKVFRKFRGKIHNIYSEFSSWFVHNENYGHDNFAEEISGGNTVEVSTRFSPKPEIFDAKTRKIHFCKINNFRQKLLLCCRQKFLNWKKQHLSFPWKKNESK